jgi:hypothetical protein
MEARLDQLEKEIAELKSQGIKPKKEKLPRAPNEYNKFLKKYVEEKKKEPDYDHKKAFKGAAVAWGENKKLAKA